MKTSLYLYIILRIVVLFSLAMASTFLPDYFRGFFGDTKVVPNHNGYVYGGMIDPDWNWGSRHYWFFWMMVLLFLLSLVDAIISIRNVVLRHYPNI